MYSDTELDKELLIFAAEQFLVFNDQNVEAHAQFVDFYNNQFIHDGVLFSEDIAILWEPYECCNIRYVCQLIHSLKNSMKTFMIGLALHENADYLSFIEMKKSRNTRV